MLLVIWYHKRVQVFASGCKKRRGALSDTPPLADRPSLQGPAREGAYSCGGATIRSLPIVTIRKSSRRFCCQQVSLCSVHTGRSSPYDTRSKRSAAMPWSTRYRLAEAARRWPRARLYSSEPRSSALPSIRILIPGLACSHGTLRSSVAAASDLIVDLSKSK